MTAKPAAAVANRRPWVAVGMASFAVAGVAIAAYLTLVKLSGGQPYCGPIVGCETVNTSPYSAVFGIPVAVFGLGASAAILGAIGWWWRTSDRRGLAAAYVIGLVSLPFLAFLTYLEVFVIHAVCVWCVGYAITVVCGWLLAWHEISKPPLAAARR
jgi:uncharacterized membrane protein